MPVCGGFVQEAMEHPQAKVSLGCGVTATKKLLLG